MRPGFIATAHHLGDQEETTLLKLTRGVHLSRLRGMDYFSTLNVNGGECVTVIRPLLGLRKDCFKEYLNCSGIRWVEDPSNTATKYSRNKIRLEVLPALRHVAGGEEALASRLQELERQSRMLAVMLHRISIDWENQHLTSSIAHSFPLTLWLDESLSELVQEELLYRFICKNAENLLKRKENNESNFSIGSSQISRIANLARNNCGNWEVSIGHKLIARNHKGMLKLHFEGENTNDNSMDFSSSCTKTASNVTISAPDYWKVTILYTNEPEEEGMVLFNIPPNSEITLRFRYPGDRFKPHWKGHGIKLKDFLRGQKVPFRERDNVVLAVLNREDTDAEKCSIIGVYPGYASTDHVKDATGFQPIKLRVIGAGENAIYKVSDTCTKKANVSSLFDDK